MMRKKKSSRVIDINESLLNVIAPIGIEFKRNCFYLGDNIGKALGIIKYPASPNYGWLSKLTNIPSTVASITWKPINGGEFMETLSRNIRMDRGRAEMEKDPLAKSRAGKSADDAENIMVQIDQHGESVGLLGVTISPISMDEDVFQKVSRKTDTACLVAQCKPRSLTFRQENALKVLSPMYTTDDLVDQIVERPVPLSSFVGGFPWAASGYNDGLGYYLAKDKSGGLIIVDPWKRGGDRTNSCWAIMGVTGVGKSTCIKHIALAEYMKGTKLIFIDPEREYKDLCNSLDGDWINAGGGINGKINPLQIKPVPDDEEDESEKLFSDKGNGMGAMALHMMTLEVFFNLYLPSLTDREVAILKSCIIELYNNFGIFWETDVTNLKNTDYPIFSDLHALIKNKAEMVTDGETNTYSDLALILEDIAKGSDSFLWNGHTSISTKTRCVCIDTKDLQNTSNAKKRTQYFNILTWAWEQMSFDRTERVMLFCDEAYLMIDQNVPQSLAFLRNVEKRCRKYEAGLAIISHSVVDFLHESIKMYGQALLDLPCFKILMGTDGINLKETRALYNLTDAEEELLASKKRGEGLLMIGSKRLHAEFEIPEYKFEYMGTAGGR